MISKTFDYNKARSNYNKARRNNEKGIRIDKDMQYNSQDLDQKQIVDIKPVQLNAHNIYVSGDHELPRIAGTTVTERGRDILPHVQLYLYFGHRCKEPVQGATSDGNGNYHFDGIPPGYYTLYARRGSLNYQSHLIKIMAGQSVQHTAMLK